MTTKNYQQLLFDLASQDLKAAYDKLRILNSALNSTSESVGQLKQETSDLYEKAVYVNMVGFNSKRKGKNA